MTHHENNLIATLQAAEPAFRAAGMRACALQSGIQEEQKIATGIPAVDIVTAADIEVQELILQALIGTTIQTECRVIAEEESPSLKEFSAESDLILAIDPIDGTKKYAKQSDSFCIVVSLLGSNGPIFTYVYFPKYNWEIEMIDTTRRESGTRPVMDLPPESDHLVGYYGRQEPTEYLGGVASQLEARGYQFRRISKISALDTTRALVLSGRLGGYAAINPSVHDGVVAYHYAQTQGYPLLPDAGIDFTCTSTSEFGVYFPGCYVYTAT